MSRSTTAFRPEPETFAITPLDAPLGARVSGLDARQPLHAEQVLALKQALRDHHILVFENQVLDDRQYLDFTGYFGAVFQPPLDVPVLSSNPDGTVPSIVQVANTEEGELGNHALPAHVDHQWTPQPSAGSLLYALEVPGEGGETLWTNLALAYAELDEDTKREIDGLRLINYNPFVRFKAGNYDRSYYGSAGIGNYRNPDVEPVPGSEHPLVRIHPESGKPLLFLSSHTEVEIPGYDPQRGQALITRLRQHLANPRFSYSHKWQVGDIVYWDNQATLHARNAFPSDQRRRLKRISLSGSRPF